MTELSLFPGLSSSGSLLAFADSGWSLSSLEGSCGPICPEKGLRSAALSLIFFFFFLSHLRVLISGSENQGKNGVARPVCRDFDKQTKQLIPGHDNSHSFFVLFNTV